MKAILEFNLPEETDEHLMAVHGKDYWSAICDMRQSLRHQLKYGTGETKVKDFAEELQNRLADALDGVPEPQ